MKPVLYHLAVNPIANVAAFILAGGQSTRMGTDKAFLQLNGRTLLERALALTQSVTPNVAIIGQQSKFSAYAAVVEDIFPNCGPLAGIHAGLKASAYEWNLILAVDLPFVSQEVLQFLIAKAASHQAIVTAPRTSEGWQPLCAIYRREFAKRAEQALRESRYKIDALFEPSTTQAISLEDLEVAGFSLALFRNLNTPQDLAEVNFLAASPRMKQRF